MAKKLHIPAPGEELPERVFAEAISITLLICAIGFFVLFQGLAMRQEAQEQAAAANQTRALDPVERVARTLRTLPDEELERVGLETKQLGAALLFGPAAPARKACMQLEAELHGARPSSLSLEERRQLATLFAAAIEQEAAHVPWGCVLRGHLDGTFSAMPVLDDVAGQVWARVKHLRADTALVKAALAELRETRMRPEHKDFYLWVRRCAMISDEREEQGACRKLTAQLSPVLGVDILDLVDQFITHQQPLSDADWRRTTAILGRIAAVGQPRTWFVKPTARRPYYQGGPSVAALLTLCRMTHHPTHARAWIAASAVAGAAGITIYSGKMRGVERVRETCRLAFGAKRPDYGKHVPFGKVRLPTVDPSPIPIVRQGTGIDGDTPRFDAHYLQTAKLCTPIKDAPRWTCGLQHWKSREIIPRRMQTLFTDTRYIQWRDDPMFVEQKRPEQGARKTPAPTSAPTTTPATTPKVGKNSGFYDLLAGAKRAKARGK